MFKSCFLNVTLERKDMQKLEKGTAKPKKTQRYLVKPQLSPSSLAGKLEAIPTWAWTLPERDTRYHI